MISIAESDGNAVLSPSGLTVSQVLDMKEAILEARHKSPRIIIDTGKITEIDTAGVQLLYSALLSSPGAVTSCELSGGSEALDKAASREGLKIK